jgi:Aspartyl/Asparaginyl beta-hydroxylase
MTQTRRAVHCSSRVTLLAIVLVLLNQAAVAFLTRTRTPSPFHLVQVRPAAKGDGGGNGFGASNSKNKTPSNKKISKKQKARPTGTTFVKSEQEELLAQLAQKAANTAIGRAVANAPPPPPGVERDIFWEMMPSLISSKFPNVKDDQLGRVAGMVRHSLDPNLPLEDEIVNNPHRPHGEIHAYMPGLGPTKPFYDPTQIQLCRDLSANYDTILLEYQALLNDMEDGGKDRFQSVTSMNYDSGWKTLVLFYNGHRIDGFPYHLCPTTTRILESVPLAGRIAGFNRQQPLSGIPEHTDGNNMWLTCQMGIKVPEGKQRD